MTPFSNIASGLRVVRHFLRKEFLQIFRNRGMLPVIFIMPLVQMIVLSNAATFDIEKVPLHLQDFDRTAISGQLVKRFTSSGHFSVSGNTFSNTSAIEALVNGNATMVLVVPAKFEEELLRNGNAKIQLMINAEDGFTAGIVRGYAEEVVAGLNRDLPELYPELAGAPRNVTTIDIRSSGWYNPELSYTSYMVPGVVVILVMMIGLFLSAMNIVREKEIGTIDQINVTPVERWQFITGKLLPFWIIGLGELTIGLIIARVVFKVPMLGSYGLIYSTSGLFLLVVLGMGLLISTMTESQQQAMFVAWFFSVIFVLLSGLFTPIESMPHWAQLLTNLNPVRHCVDIMRRIMLKGAGLDEISIQLAILAAQSIAMLALAVNRYSKVSA